MAADGDEDRSWRLFTSEDMIQGYKPLKRRKTARNVKKSESLRTAAAQAFCSDNSEAPRTSESSAAVAERVRSTDRKRLIKEDIPARRPFTDITNQDRTVKTKRRETRDKARTKKSRIENAELKECSRNLFEEEFIHGGITTGIVYDENCEETRFQESCDSLFDSDNSYDDYVYPISEDTSSGESDIENSNCNLPQRKMRTSRASRDVIPEEYATLGAPSRICSHCNAQMWHEERVNKCVTKGKPLFSICCRRGEVKLPEPEATPNYLLNLYRDDVRGSKFQRSIRLYNAMFAFTSAGGNVDHSINRGRGPYIYRLNGQNHHVFGSLIPDDGDTPKFCQLYIYDTANEVNNHLRWVKVSDEQPVDVEIVQGLMQMLDDTNELVDKFRIARDRWENNDICDLKVELKICRAQNGRENHISASDEVAGIMVGFSSNTTPDRDIIIEAKSGKLQRVSYIHPKFMALQYPLLFPNGEDGYHDKIPFQSADLSNLKDRDFISLKDYYAYQFQIRQNCTFRSNQPLDKVAEREKDRMSKLEAFFHLCANNISARQYTYQEVPEHFVWDDGQREWRARKRGYQIGRLSYTHHSSGEVWFMRLLLTKVKGPTSFAALRTVNGVCYDTYRDACKEYGLLDDDKEWHEVLDQCSSGGLPPQIRQLFVQIIVNCKVTDLSLLWSKHWQQMVDDIVLKRRRLNKDDSLMLDDQQLQYYALAEIDNLLRSIGKLLKNYSQLPQPPENYLNHGTNNLILEETNYNTIEMEAEYKKLEATMNDEQLNVYNSILDSVGKNKGGLFFVHGSGGCGKTFLWRTLISKLRSQADIVLPVASSGIAATLMAGGRTAHSRFKIPIVLDEFSVCGIGNKSDIAELIRHTKLIIWDEAPMQHRFAFECLDRSLRDIMRSSDESRSNLPFGGITVVLGGDFRQILPVIPHADRAVILEACITRSRLWNICQIFILKKNMRLNKGTSPSETEELNNFAKWVLAVGDGKVENHQTGDNLFEDEIEVPLQFCDLENDNSVENMITNIYPDFVKNAKDPKYLSERAILTPTNQTVGHLNSLIVEMIPGDSTTYYSVDSAEDFGGTDEDLHSAFPIEYLNSLNIPGLPAHDLKLKPGVVVMLMRNLNQTLGLCNGTRMIVTKCLKFCVECEVICGSFIGTRHFIPRMELSPSDSALPFKLVRKQMPLQICYAMTINKSQGQSLQTVGLFLPKAVFTHGQLYVAISRVTSPAGLKVFIDDDRGFPTNITKNVVYKEVFYALPK